MKQFNVTGMSCAACSARVEKAVSAVEGVTSCSVSLLTNSMGVEGTASDKSIISAVEKAGYGASPKVKEKTKVSNADELKDTQTPLLLKRFAFSLAFLLTLMYFSMGHGMFSFPLPDIFDKNHALLGFVQMLLSAAVLVINQRFFISGFKGLIHRAPNMDTLVSLGSGASFLWSVYVLFRMIANPSFSDHFYFESAAMILVLITVGKILEARSKGKTTDALKALMKIKPETATVIENGEEKTVSVDGVAKGDVFVVRPGDRIPVDGEVLEGASAVDESFLTGESVPVDKQAGDRVYAASINKSGFLKCRATDIGEDTSLSKIIQMVSDAAATKAPIAKIADRVSGVFVPVVILISVITLLIWLILGREFSFSLERAISVLVISCPCALGLATPVAIMVGNGVAARNGILFKTASSLEQTGKTQIVVLDKTGTVTKGEPAVTDIIPCSDISEERLLSLAASLEKKSSHPLAEAVVKKAENDGLELSEVTDFENMEGNGVKACLDSKTVQGGSVKHIGGLVSLTDETLSECEELAKQGKTPLLFTLDNSLMGIIAVSDVIREDSPEAIRQLKNMGIRVIMLTGDNETTANAIGKQAGVDRVIASVLPDGKQEVVSLLKNSGRVMMVGDGINDAPALTSAHIGVAIGKGADVAVDAADVVLVNSALGDVPAAIRMSRATLRNIKQNLFWAFFYNAIGIPLAAGAYIGVFGWELNPMFGAAAMSLSSFFVVTNALRLNLFKLKSPARDKKIKQVEVYFDNSKQDTEETKMTKTMKINGMMCPHCEATVKKALESIDGVEKAEVSHEKGEAVVTLSKDVDNAVLKTAVEEKEYGVTDIA